MNDPSPWAGIWIAEDIELIAQGVESGSWIDTTLGLTSAGLDGLALISDPAGALLQYGIAWLIEHVKPLSEALDWLAGDPARISASASTWRHVAGSLTAEADAVTAAARADLIDWSGAAAEAYEGWIARREQTLRTLARAGSYVVRVLGSENRPMATRPHRKPPQTRRSHDPPRVGGPASKVAAPDRRRRTRIAPHW